jgi:hypothetical protein
VAQTSMADVTLTVGANEEQITAVVVHGHRSADQEVEQQLKGDLRDHLSANMNLRDRIENSKDVRHASGVRHSCDYNQEREAPQHGRALLGGNIPGLRPFTDRLRAVV